MAKQVMPEATLPVRSGQIDLPEQLFTRLSLFTQMKNPPSLDKFPGTVSLCRFRKGEVICRHGEPGWTAFYVLTGKDVQELRDYPRRRLRDIPQELAKNQDARQNLRVEKEAIEAVLPQQSGKEAETSQKKLATLQRDLEKLDAAIVALQAEAQLWPDVAVNLDRELAVSTDDKMEREKARRVAAERFDGLVRQAESAGDSKRLDWYQELRGLPAAKKRSVADALQGANPEMAAILHELAHAEDGLTVMAAARLPLARPTTKSPGLIARLKNWFGGQAAPSPGPRPAYIPNDGPRDISYDSRGASLYEGDLFGEISCLYRTPRSATVVATEDCYLLEMLRNILEAVQKDPGQRARIEDALKKRLVETFMRELPIFSVLGDQQLALLHARAELVNFEPGSIICDEHDRADCMYLIGTGIVKVMKNVSWLLETGDIADWPAFAVELREAGKQDVGPAHWLWEHLPANVRLAIPATGEDWSAGQKAQAVQALNDLIKDPALHEAAACQALIRSKQLGRKVWQLLAERARATLPELCRCNRQVLEAVFPGIIPACTGGESPSDNPWLLRAAEIGDWKTFCARLVGENKNADDPGRTFWSLLDDATREAMRRGAAGEAKPEIRTAISAGINDLLAGQPLCLFANFSSFIQEKAQVGKKLMEFLPKKERWTAWLFHRFVRAFHRLALEALFPRSLGHAAHPTGLPLILAYRSRGEFFGEMGLMEKAPRSATCVAYNHPDNDPEREVGPVQMVRISQELFDELLATVPVFREKVAEITAARKQQTRAALETPGVLGNAALLHSDRATELGLIEGQKLMLIDLDRCTRCDECVQACVSTHADRRSRLFLDGPRFDKYLVPATCRSCLDPVCMIGCPVGSIHRGNNRQIIIEDWCIGCERCARQCPYGAIQMHDTGIIREGARGWRFLPEGLATAAWVQPGFDDRHWHEGKAPFGMSRALRDILGTIPTSAAICFRHAFELSADRLGPDTEFTLEITSADDAAAVWLNGTALVSAEKPKRGKREFVLLPGLMPLRKGRNVLAVKIILTPGKGDVLLDGRLDEVRRPGLASGAAADITEKPVTRLAVVCDLCSSLSAGPACVRACPHDAAIRVDARTEFP